MVKPIFYQKFIRYAAVMIWCVSFLAMLGWLLGIEVLTQVLPDLPTMKFNTAFSFFLLACVIFCTQEKRCFKVSQVLNFLLLALTLTTLLQDIGSLNFGIDQLITLDQRGIDRGNPTPGRMSMATSLSFILLSISLMLIRSGNKKARKLASYFTLLVVLTAFFAIIAFIYQVPTFNKITFISSMAIHTAIGFLISGMAISLIIPKYGITELFTSKRLGSFMIRKLFFQLLLAIVLVSYLTLWAFRKGYFAADFSISLVAVLLIFVSVLMLMFVATTINRIDREKRAAQQELQAIQLYLNATPDPLIVVNKKGAIEVANQLMTSVFGYTSEELEGKTMTSLIPQRFHAKHREHLQTYLEQIDSEKRNKKKQHGSTVIEVFAVKKNGEEFPVEMTLNSTRTANGFITIAAFRDISRRVNAENKLQTALEASIVGIWDFDLVSNQLHWDETMYRLYGSSSSTEQSNYELWKSRVHEDDVDEIETLLQAAIAGNAHYDTNFRVIWPDGSLHYIMAKGTVYRDENNKPVRMLGTNWDVTEQKALESSLVEARRKAEQASKSKSEFLANMSHEIRTPLNGIIGFTDLLMKTPLTESQDEYLRNVNISANLLLDVINDILDFSKIEAGKIELHWEEIDIYELCEQTIDIVRHQADQKKLEVLLNIDPNVKRYIYADPVRLRQILTNLLANAVKFTKKGEVELKIESQKCPGNQENKACFLFKVRDTGIGIAANKMHKIFGAFDQEDTSTTRKYGGTGLGLTISNKLLALMDSRLQVKSELHKGSEFYFEVEFDASDRKPSQKGNLDHHIRKALVVDDNLRNRQILEGMLATMDIETVLAANGIEAINLLKNHQFDLAIVDYNMPYMSGTDVIKYFRKTLNLTSEEFPIMLLHSTSEDAVIVQATRDYEINYTATKPINSDRLKNIIDKLGKEVAPKTENEHISEAVSENKSTIASEENITVLVAEDNLVNQLLAREILGKVVPNARLFMVENGLEAVEAYQSEKPDLIFMDIQMPEMNGLEATREIRKIEETLKVHIPIIAFTARALKGERETCLANGMDDYLSKPIVLEKLKTVLDHYLVS
ncbi:MAG: response regulator [Christiangramia sp.]|nr:hypothetical protein [Christiangramia sp.]